MCLIFHQNAAFPSQDPFSGSNGPVDRGGFENDDAFASGTLLMCVDFDVKLTERSCVDQFKSSSHNNGTGGDPFSDPFAASFPAAQTSGFSSDPFASFGGGAAEPPGE